MRLLAGHPGASVAFATAQSAAGERHGRVELVRIEDAPLARVEIVLSALPHGVSARYVQEARALGKRAVDLSADFRLSPDAVYGLTEVTRPHVATADRKSTRLNSSHSQISYAVFCLKKKKRTDPRR